MNNKPEINYFENEREAMEVRRGTSEWYLYHSIKNEDALLPVIALSIIILFVPGGIVGDIVIWILYYLYCESNNAALNRDPEIQKQRAMYLRAKMRYIKKK